MPNAYQLAAPLPARTPRHRGPRRAAANPAGDRQCAGVETSLAGGNSLLVAVTLTAQTPLGGSAVSLTYSDQTVHSNAQKGLTIPQGQSLGSFALSTIATATSITVTVTGSLGASAANATFTVRSPQPRRRTQRRVLADGDGNRFR